jgi:hypothetical protein
MMKAIGRLIRARQEEKIIKSSIQEVKFNILQDVRYSSVWVAACQHSPTAGKCIFFAALFKSLTMYVSQV